MSASVAQNGKRVFLLALFAVLLVGGAQDAWAHPNDVCMSVLGVEQQDETTLVAAVAVEKTVQLRNLEEGIDEAKRFFLQWDLQITDEIGNEVVLISQEAELVPPFSTVLLPHCEHPGLGDGVGGAPEIEYIQLQLSTVWDGTDAAGNPVDPGDYPFHLSGRLVRAIETGNTRDDHVNGKVIGDFGPASGIFTVPGAGLTVDIVANPTSGVRPLRVRFTPEAESTGTSITGYRWDFNGDGIFDTGYDPRPSTRIYTYNQAGVYDALLEVRTQDGNTAQAFERIIVTNPPPTVSVQVVPSNGPAPLDVTFSVSASSPNGSIVSVQIDPGDGSPLIELPSPGSAPHTYQEAGTYAASVTVTDSAGETATVRDLALDVRIGEPGSPIAVASASPTSGSAPLTVYFSSTGSSDPDGTIVLYEWDFDFDGTTFAPDASSPSAGTTTHTYDSSGEHFAALRVTDDTGLQSLDVVKVFADLDVTVTVPDDTVNPYLGESVNVTTRLTGGAEITIYLRDRFGRRVRTLFSGFRNAGTYNDSWDGRNDDGDVLLDGDYYAEAEFELAGEILIEPDTLSGGAFRFVSWSQNYSYGQTFDPWEDQFWRLTFDTARRGAGASEVTLWITPYRNRGEITATLLNNRVFGSGQYNQWWDGVKDDGMYIEPRGQRRASGNDYLWSAQAFTLPDNAIVIEGGRPEITSPAVDANVFYPTTYRCLTGHGNTIDFALSRDASVTVRIYNMGNGNLLRTLRTPVLAAGANSLEWDGKTNSGEFAAPGRYRAEITAVSENGNESLLRRVLILVTY